MRAGHVRFVEVEHMAQSIKYVRTLTKSDLSPILILMGLIGYGLVIDPSNGSHGIYAPVDEHAKLGITPPFHPGIVLCGRFGLGGHDRGDESGASAVQRR